MNSEMLKIFNSFSIIEKKQHLLQGITDYNSDVEIQIKITIVCIHLHTLHSFTMHYVLIKCLF